MDKLNRKLEMAKKFNGVFIRGKQYFSRAVAEQITEMSRQTLAERCRKVKIPIIDDCGKIFYDRLAMIEAIGKGLFEKRDYAKGKKKGHR